MSEFLNSPSPMKKAKESVADETVPGAEGGEDLMGEDDEEEVFENAK